MTSSESTHAQNDIGGGDGSQHEDSESVVSSAGRSTSNDDNNMAASPMDEHLQAGNPQTCADDGGQYREESRDEPRDDIKVGI